MLNKLLLYSLALIFCYAGLRNASAQLFVDVNAGLIGLAHSSGAWGDYDNDRDLDLVISGTTAAGLPVTRIYSNQNGVFTDMNFNLPGFKNGWVAWGDYDNDGDLDILATGENTEQKAYIFRNNNGIFEIIDPGFGYYGAYSFGCWVDYDSDGFPDVLLTGSWKTTLYRNNGNGTFSDTGFTLPDLMGGRAAWGDLDHDGDADLLLSGDSGGGQVLYLFINNNGEFEQHELANMGLCNGSIELGDYNADGFEDILIMGFNDYYEPEANIYRNNGDMTFTNIYAGLAPVALGSAAWGDLDNDGDLDIVLTGKLAGCGAIVTEVYENIGNNYFNNLTAGLVNAEYSFVALGDFDNDTDLDILLLGKNYNGNSFTKIYRNDMGLPNFLPVAPQNLNIAFTYDGVILSWDKATDMQTPQNGLYYNIRIATTPLGTDIISPMSHMSDGLRKISARGNAGQSNLWRVNGLEAGTTYYWSVQTLDNTYAASAFSDEMSFTVLNTNLSEAFVGNTPPLVFPNPARETITVNVRQYPVIACTIFSMSGQRILHWERNDGNEIIDIKNLEKGIYLIEFTMNDEPVTEKLVVR